MLAFANETLVRRRFAGAVENAFGAARSAIRTRALLTAFAIFLIFASVVVMLWIGARDVLTGAMSPGTLSQFLLYAVFAAGALGALSEVWGELSQASGAAERLAELMVEKPAIAAPENPDPLPEPSRGDIAFDHVSFHYPARPEISALKDVAFTIASGETVAIVGPSGAGKSTIFSLLLRFYDPQSGTIRFDGIDIRRLDPQALRRRIAMVPQDTTIFAATAMENILFGRPQASREEVQEAARAAHADEFIAALPQGYDTQLGERGVTLSGGQRQRIAIARAILQGRADAAPRRGDERARRRKRTAVQHALDRLMQDRTTIVIAHRLATVQKADRIMVLDERHASSRKAPMPHSSRRAASIPASRDCSSMPGRKRSAPQSSGSQPGEPVHCGQCSAFRSDFSAAL